MTSYPRSVLDRIPFDPWWKDPAILADLVEWIDYRRPMSIEDVTDLLRNPGSYAHDFEQMVAYGGAKLGGPLS